MGLDPLRASRTISESYRRYLETSFLLRNEELAAQFHEQLSRDGKLVKGPYLEVTPPFKMGASIAQMVTEGLLSPRFKSLCKDNSSLPFERPLYLHQDTAIRKAVAGRRNLVVATGTGSGKTEAFLVPILDHLLRQQDSGKLSPGVRALLLYPMNALANDQLKRLRRLLARYPSITFGRYTGETKNSEKEAESIFRANCPNERRLPNEMLSRVEMRGSPPHLLLTNYAMLEYLLLRPLDCELFDGIHAREWRFLVVDEAHTYYGAKGIESAMLLRRLKDRVVASERGRLQCMATSATLGRGVEDFPAAVRFAAGLFDERFEFDAVDQNRQDVVDAARIPLDAFGTPWGAPQAAIYAELRAAMEDLGVSVDMLATIAEKRGVPSPTIESARLAADIPEESSPSAFLYTLLSGDERLHQLRRILQGSGSPGGGPRLLADVGRRLFGSSDDPALVALVDLAVKARLDEESLPLLPARYHLFVRALEGCYVRLSPSFQLTLDRAETEEVEGRTCRVFEIASCRRCGQVYLVGQSRNGKLLSPPVRGADSTPGYPEFYRLLDRTADAQAVADEDEDVAEAADEDVAVVADASELALCGFCGALAGEAGNRCGCGDDQDGVTIRVQKTVLGVNHKVNYCPTCGARSPGVVGRFLTGQDGPAAVLATALYQQIPAPAMKAAGGERTTATANDAANEVEDDWSAVAVAPAVAERGAGHASLMGRQLLVFSDSRQDAAFFACYLDRTYSQLLRRRLIVEVLRRNPDAIKDQWHLQDLVSPLWRTAKEYGLFAEMPSEREQKAEVWRWLITELRATDRRNCLEGLGFIWFDPVRPETWEPPLALGREPWCLTKEGVWNLYRLLLDSFRHHAAITFPDQVLPSDAEFAPRNREYFFRCLVSAPRRGVFAWCSGAKGKKNRRLDFLLRLHERLKGTRAAPDQMNTVLASMWSKTLVNPGTCFAEQIRRADLQGEGVVYRHDYRFYRLAAPAEGWHRCRRCGSLTRINLHEVCPAHGCDGRFEPALPDEVFKDNHYARTYRAMEPLPMVVEEHTAQLSGTRAAELQDQFVNKRVNVLSCSTTFELGVDVGELEAVFLRNVPPTTANYVQRAGRAGRRTDSTAFALTYCQRRSHDLTYFQRPEQMISGRISAPQFEIVNEKIVRRHMYSVALAWFFRQRPELFGSPGYVEDFFLNEELPNGSAAVSDLLRGHPAEVQESLARIVPAELQQDLGVADWSWLDGPDGLIGAEPGYEGVLARADRSVRGDIDELNLAYAERVHADPPQPADHLLRAIKTIRRRPLIGFLANHNVLPKYGFPVDVVELEIMHHCEEARRLELDRDLRIAIAEYAPGSEIVAGGKLWTSRALKRPANMEWPKFYHATCRECGRFHRSKYETGLKPEICECGAVLMGFRYLQPLFGFRTDAAEAPRRPSEARPDRSYSTRVFFVSQGDDAREMCHLQRSDIHLRGLYSKTSRLAVLNQSQFLVCQSCGRAAPIDEGLDTPHPRPWASDVRCDGIPSRWNLGHDFNTDVFDLRFENVVNPESYWWSMLYALLEGASEALNIHRDDLDGCLFPYAGRHTAPALILFDNVPGGAGHVRRLGKSDEQLIEVLRAAHSRVSGTCGCGGGIGGPGDTSCYGCLRNYRNEWLHDQLQRRPVEQVLRRFLLDSDPVT